MTGGTAGSFTVTKIISPALPLCPSFTRSQTWKSARSESAITSAGTATSPVFGSIVAPSSVDSTRE